MVVYCPYPKPGSERERAVDGLISLCGANSDHVDRFGRPPTVFIPITCPLFPSIPIPCSPQVDSIKEHLSSYWDVYQIFHLCTHYYFILCGILITNNTLFSKGIGSVSLQGMDNYCHESTFVSRRIEQPVRFSYTCSHCLMSKRERTFHIKPLYQG